MIRILSGQLKILKRKLKGQEKALSRLQKGCLIQKMIKGRPYFYLVSREGKKVRTLYIGKASDQSKNKYEKIKTTRKQLRAEVCALRKEIGFRARLLATLQKASDQGLDSVLLIPPIIRLKA